MNSFKKTESKEEKGSEEKTAQPVNPKKKKFAKSVHKLLNGEFLAKEGLTNHIPFIAFLTGLFLLHIALMYFFENTQREIVRTQRALNELNSDYKSTESELEMRMRQSQVAVQMEALGLKELRTPPNQIYVKPGFFSEEE